jgi:hypothetical protein
MLNCFSDSLQSVRIFFVSTILAGALQVSMIMWRKIVVLPLLLFHVLGMIFLLL